MTEEERIRTYYTERIRSGKNYDKPLDMQHVLMIQDLERKIVEILAKHHICDISMAKVLDVGCGDGWVLRKLVQFGAKPSNIYGYDLMQSNVDYGKERCRDMNLRCGNVADIDLPEGYFDIIIQFTCFSSITDDKMRIAIADKMIKSLQPNGIILWFDMCKIFGNNELKPVTISDIWQLFPNLIYDLSLCTVGKYADKWVGLIAKLVSRFTGENKFLNTHYFGIIRKNKLNIGIDKMKDMLVGFQENIIREKLGIWHYIVPRFIIRRLLVVQASAPRISSLPNGQMSMKQNLSVFWIWQNEKCKKT